MVLIAAAASKTARDEKKRHKTLFYTRTLTHSLNTLVAGVWVCFFLRSFVRSFVLLHRLSGQQKKNEKEKLWIFFLFFSESDGSSFYCLFCLVAFGFVAGAARFGFLLNSWARIMYIIDTAGLSYFALHSEPHTRTHSVDSFVLFCFALLCCVSIVDLFISRSDNTVQINYSDYFTFNKSNNKNVNGFSSRWPRASCREK